MNNCKFETIIWNKGDKPEKSAKRTMVETFNEYEPKNTNTFSSSILSLEPPSMNVLSSIYRESNNKRQECSDKISERYLIQQRGQNPFISHSSYVNDIETQQSFLIPKCSNEHPKGKSSLTL